MKKRRLKKKPIIILLSIVLCFILMVFSIKLYRHYTSYEYKLGRIGYSDDEIQNILKLDKQFIKYALKNKYDKYFVSLTSQKYFIWKNYKKYKSYINDKYKNSKVDYDDVIIKINTKTNYDYYTHTTMTNMDLGYGILVNKYYSLPEKYAPDDIVNMSSQYSYPGNSIRKEVYEAFKEMADRAKEDKITLIVNSSYRDYATQKEIYDDYADKNGKEYADKFAARADFSEHQTGLALDIFTPGAGMKTFEGTDASKWLLENSYKYGFILRYPPEKENITGYAYESWHYRYLGKELAKKVYESGLTFDEYYAFYLEK
ncbi:MAG: M15 family metallopeptidase [Bacilli bacterium]|nr:M15 family metallopeptidase [Bacilli bacterium]